MTRFSLIMVFSNTDDIFDLRECLRTNIDEQSLKPEEVIIVLNGFKNSALPNIGYQHKSIRLIKSEDMLPLAAALNLAIHEAQTDIIARIDPDDQSLPDRFHKQIDILEKNPEISVCGTSVIMNDRVRHYPETDTDIKKKMNMVNPIAHPSVMFRKANILKVGGYDIVLKAQDYLLWLKLRAVGEKFYNIQNPLVRLGTLDLVNRRGPSYFKQEMKIIWIAFTRGFIPLRYSMANVTMRFVARFSPKFVKKWFYRG